jgi:hypothetical protein
VVEQALPQLFATNLHPGLSHDALGLIENFFDEVV